MESFKLGYFGYFMSENEEMASRGRLLTDYGEAKRHLATLEAEAERIGKSLQNLSRMLLIDPSHVIFGGQNVTGEYLKLQTFDAKIASDIGRLPELVQEIRSTKAEIERLRPKLAALGMDDYSR